MGEIKYVAGILMLVLFTVAIIGYAINFGIDNDTAININEDAQFNALSNNLGSNLSQFRTDTDSGSESLMTSQIASGSDNMQTGQAFKVGIVPMVNTLKAITQTIKDKIFGGSSALGIFITALIGFMIYAGFRYIWQTWKGGNP